MAAVSQATIAMRGILHTDNIIGENKGDLIQISQCLNISQYFLRAESKCYNQIPITFVINNHTVNRGFLTNNNLREIVYNSPSIPCDRVIQSFYRLNNLSYVTWTGKELRDAGQLAVIHFQTAIAFKESDNFHISHDKIFSEESNAIHHLMHLEEISSKTKALTDLIVMMSSDTDLSLEEVKDVASRLHTSTEEVLKATARTFKRLIPSYTGIITVVAVLITVTIVFVLLVAYLKYRQTQLTLTLHQPANTATTRLTDDSNTENYSAPVMRLRELLDRCEAV